MVTAEWVAAVESRWPDVVDHFPGASVDHLMPEEWPEPNELNDVARAMLKARNHIYKALRSPDLIDAHRGHANGAIGRLTQCLAICAHQIAAERGIKL